MGPRKFGHLPIIYLFDAVIRIVSRAHELQVLAQVRIKLAILDTGPAVKAFRS